jgi:maleate cis-trans isomerase
MTGRPRRVGLMIPSSNTMMEVDFARDLPPGTALHTARMYMEDTTPAGENRMLDEFALPAARDLGTARPDVVVFGCTSAGALRGNDYDAQLCQQISELTGAPVVSTNGAGRAPPGPAAAARRGGGSGGGGARSADLWYWRDGWRFRGGAHSRAGGVRATDSAALVCLLISVRPGARVGSTWGAGRTAIEAAGAASVGVITPYVDELNEKIRESIQADGIDVAAITGLGITDNFQIAEVAPEEIVAFAVRALGPLAVEGVIDLIFASCTNFGAMTARPAIAERLGVPVVTSNQAVLAAAVARLQALWSPPSLSTSPPAATARRCACWPRAPPAATRSRSWPAGRA